MSETLNINEFEANQGKIDKLTSKTATINTLDSQNVTINTLTADFIKLKNQIELLSEELKIIKGSKELVKITSDKTEIKNDLYVKNELVSLPIGTVIAFAGKNVPDGWLLCDGLAISEKYTEARNIIGNNTPNLIRKYIMGSPKNDFTAFGTEQITIKNENIHENQLQVYYNLYKWKAGRGGSDESITYLTSSVSGNTNPSYYEDFKGMIRDSYTRIGHAKPTAIDILPPSIKMVYIIKVK